MYKAKRSGQYNEFYENAEFNPETREYENPNVEKPTEIQYWRKHSSLHGWMKQLWESKGNSGEFNGDELELTLDDIFDLELAIKTRSLPPTTGFFFGSPSDERYYETDLKFVGAARAAINGGSRVFYNSSW